MIKWKVVVFKVQIFECFKLFENIIVVNLRVIERCLYSKFGYLVSSILKYGRLINMFKFVLKGFVEIKLKVCLLVS